MKKNLLFQLAGVQYDVSALCQATTYSDCKKHKNTSGHIHQT
jgi:hypothetical protein